MQSLLSHRLERQWCVHCQGWAGLSYHKHRFACTSRPSLQVATRGLVRLPWPSLLRSRCGRLCRQTLANGQAQTSTALKGELAPSRRLMLEIFTVATPIHIA